MQKTNIATFLLLIFLITQPGWLAADTASHRQAVEKLFRLTSMQQKIDASVDNVLALQLQQNPELRAHEGELRSFLEKYIGWESLKNEITSMYLQAFTEQELNEINDFYASPAGHKLILKIPELVRQRDGIAVQRLQGHINELQSRIQSNSRK